jgi:hypothetical protein
MAKTRNLLMGTATDQRSVLLAKQELGGNCVPKQELGNETRSSKQ